MTALIEYLDELDLLVRNASRSKTQPEEFVAGMHDAMDKVSKLLAGNPPAGFLDAYSNLTREILEYEQNPNLEGVGRIGNALVRYRTAATSGSIMPACNGQGHAGAI
jgi:hypothetical protein